MSRRILSVIMSVVLLVGLMPLPAFAGDSDDESYAAGLLKANGLTLAPAGNEKPEPKKVTYFNDGDAPTLQVEYEEVKAGSLTLNPADYTVSYKDAGGKDVQASALTNVGTYTVTVTGKGNFTGSAKASYTITAKPAPTPVPVSKKAITSVTLKRSSAKYTGKAIKPVVKAVKAGNTTLSSSNYTVTYKNAKGKAVKASAIKNAGKYTVVVTGKGDFTGSKSATFTVKKAKPKATTSLKKTFKAKVLKKKALSFAPVKLATDGKVAYSVAKKDPKKVLSLNKKTGKVTVKKGTKKDTYVIKVKASAKAGKNHSAFAAKTYKVQVTVK